jgi:GT2 family glycosyltransferase
MSTTPSRHEAINRVGPWRLPFKPSGDESETSALGLLLWMDGAPLAHTADSATAITGVAVVVCTHQRPLSLKRFLDSLAEQDRVPDELIIVDASEDDETERMLSQLPGIVKIVDRCLYFRVSGSLKGITRQRNFALRWVTSDLVVFFDDDVVLLPHCLREMEHVHRDPSLHVAGVGAFMRNQAWPLSDSWVWRTRQRLGLVRDLQPGRYHRSGISIPWNLVKAEGLVEGDWLPGCAMMWKTATAREVGFYEGFAGYAQGEDLEFSLRARKHGKLLVAGMAHVIHLYESSGRPDAFKRGYMAINNRYQIHRRTLSDRTWRDIVWFSYACTLDTLLLARHIIVPNQWGAILLQIAGRTKAVFDIMSRYFKRAWHGRAAGTQNTKQGWACSVRRSCRLAIAKSKSAGRTGSR